MCANSMPAVKPRREVGGGDEILGKSAVDAVARVALTLAEGLPAGLAIFAPQAAIVQPGNAYGIALLEVLNAGAERCDNASHLVTWHERYVRLYRPIPVGRVQSVWQTPHAMTFTSNAPRTGIGNRNVVDRQRPSEPVNDRSLHGLCHRSFLQQEPLSCSSRRSWTSVRRQGSIRRSRFS